MSKYITRGMFFVWVVSDSDADVLKHKTDIRKTEEDKLKLPKADFKTAESDGLREYECRVHG